MAYSQSLPLKAIRRIQLTLSPALPFSWVSASGHVDDAVPGRDDGRYSEQAEDEAPPQYTPVASSSSAVATANESAYATSASQHPGGGAASSSGAATTTTTKPSGSGTDEGGLQAHDIRELNPEAQKKVLQARDEQGASLADYALFDSSEPPPAQGYHHHNSAPGQYEYTLDDEGNMISHDPALATDPDKLAAFLRLHASAPPVVSVRVHGSHMEERTEIVHHHHQHGGSSHHHHHHDSSSLRFSSGSQTRTRQERVTDFHFVVSAADAVERALGSARGTGGAGPLGAVLYAAGPWELAHRGGVTRSLVLKPPSSSRPRHQRGIRLPDNDADLEASLADASQQEQQHQEPRSHRPRVKDRRRLDRETRERTGKGMPGFVHPENLKEIRHMGAETDWHERRPRLLHDYFVDLGEEHCAIPLGACAPPDVVERYHDVVKERDDRDAAVRAVLDAFCRSEKALKELTVTKEVYGWHLDGLVEGVKEIVRRSLYSGDVTVQVQVSPRTITIRPPHPAARLWSQPVYIKLMLWLLLMCVPHLFQRPSCASLNCARLTRTATPSCSSSRCSPATATTAFDSRTRSLAGAACQLGQRRVWLTRSEWPRPSCLRHRTCKIHRAKEARHRHSSRRWKGCKAQTSGSTSSACRKARGSSSGNAPSWTPCASAGPEGSS